MSTAPVVTVFVRHSSNCKYRDDEFWKKCSCRKHLRWTHNGKQHRKKAGTRSWAEAEEKKRKLEAQYEGKPAYAEREQQTIERAVELFLASKTSQGVDGQVVKKYERELERLKDFCSSRSKLFVSEILLEDLVEFRAKWDQLYPSSATRQQVQTRLRGFLRYCYDACWLDRVPRLSPIQADEPPTLPLSAEEYDQLLAAIPKEFEDSSKAKKVRALVQLMRYSGLAIRDAVTLRRSEIQWDSQKEVHRVTTSRQKTGTHVSVPIPLAVGRELLAVVNGHPDYLFWNTGTGKEQSAVTNWQHDLRSMFRAAGFPTGHPHQLRDTAAVEWLKAGIPLEEVSKLLGHESIKTTERSYAQWVKARQDRLDDLVMGSWKARKKKVDVAVSEVRK
jgi:integrase/recombinase XerD